MNELVGVDRPNEPGRVREAPVVAEGFRERLERVLEESAARRADRAQAAREEMEMMEAGLQRFDALARRWMDELIVPRLETVAGIFPHSLGVRASPGAWHVTLAFTFTDDYPADARIDVTLDHDLPQGRVRVRVSPSIIPILMDYRGETEMEFEIEVPDHERLTDFLEQALVRFVSAYLTVSEPDSMYQRDRLVTDVVCSMRIRRAEAVASTEHDGRIYHFCAAGCRERFVTDPGRYARGIRGGGTGENHGTPA